MSLVKQLILGIGLFLLLAFSGSFLVSLETSREQLQSQLASHAQDAATALGLSLTPHVDDPAMAELMVSSIFDTGYFSSIRLIGVSDNSLLTARSHDLQETRAPGWFVRLVNLQPGIGEALIMHGWQQHARVEVISHPQFALNRLWDSALGILGWLVLCGLVAALLGSRLLRLQLRPLLALADQAEAITRREYRTLGKVPRTPELRHVVLAMNQMVGKLKRLFDEEAARTESYRRQAYQDELTGLANRQAFTHTLSAALTAEDATTGHLLGLRLGNLNQLNQTLGAQRTDQLLGSLAAPLLALQTQHPNWLCSRSRGGEFVILAPASQQQELLQTANGLRPHIAALEDLHRSDHEPLQMGLADYHPGDTLAVVLQRLDQALSESSCSDLWLEPGLCIGTASVQANPDDWQSRLQSTLDDRRFVIHFQAVIDSRNSQTLHHKVLVRLIGDTGELIHAGRFLPWIERLGMAQDFDLCMLEMTLSHLRQHPSPLALSLMPATLADSRSLEKIASQLDRNRPQAALLTLEVDARHLYDSTEIAAFAERLRPCGTRLALQHFGRQLSMIGELALIGLAYLKIDSSFIRNLDKEKEKHLYLEALANTAQRIDLPLIAEQVQSDGEAEALKTLGITAMQGLLLAAPAAWQERD